MSSCIMYNNMRRKHVYILLYVEQFSGGLFRMSDGHCCGSWLNASKLKPRNNTTNNNKQNVKEDPE